MTDQIAEAFELLAQDQLLTTADHMRQAFRLYLTQLGAMKVTRPAMNGQHHARADHG